MLYWIYTLWKDAQAQGVDWAETFSFFRLLGYITLRAGLAATIAFSLSLFLGGRVIRKLISLKVGQPIRTAEEVHKLAELHGGKAGTPTMGGIMILGTVFLAVLLCADMTNPFVLVTLVVTLALGILGFLDDYKKIVEKSSDGVSGKLKLVWQGVVGLGAALFLCYNPQTSEYLFYSGGEVTEPTTVKVTSVSFPLLTFVIPLGLLAIPFFMALLVGTSNAVNLTDGLDGLATGVTVTVAMAYAIICYLSGEAHRSAHIFLKKNEKQRHSENEARNDKAFAKSQGLSLILRIPSCEGDHDDQLRWLRGLEAAQDGKDNPATLPFRCIADPGDVATNESQYRDEKKVRSTALQQAVVHEGNHDQPHQSGNQPTGLTGEVKVLLIISVPLRTGTR
ncbi:hypothetical protein N9908_05535 [Akkermansiaceae bacterium]|nr:hypothetical protein [Akkermansiaceae bacterium]